MGKTRDLFRRRQWQATPVLLPRKSHGWRSLVGCSPWGLEESDTTERLRFHFSLSCIGEGNGNPLQCSQGWGNLVGCATYGVAQSQTRLKWLSSSSELQRCHFCILGSWQSLIYPQPGYSYIASSANFGSYCFLSYLSRFLFGHATEPVGS